MIALAPQPPGRSWPTLAWAVGEPDSGGGRDQLEDVIDEVLQPARDAVLRTLAVVVVQGGRIVAERYGPGVSPQTPLLSWSTAKSITHAAVGIAVRDGLMDPDSPVAAPEWPHDDPRAAITTKDLLRMRSGLAFAEDYVDADSSDAIEMLFGQGVDDVAGYAASRPLEHPIDEVFSYSSGTTNIISRHLADCVGATGDAADRRRSMARFLRDELFDPIGMTSASPRFDASGTFVGSSYVDATARDFARFGLLYLRDGVWDGERILPEGWVDAARTARSVDPDDGWLHSEHWWVRDDELGTFWANGYEGQRIRCVPAIDTVVVRLGRTSADHGPMVDRFVDDLVDALR